MGPTSFVIHCERDDVFLRGHEACTLTHVARRLADLLGCPFAGRHDRRRRYPGKLFVFAVDPLLPPVARALGVTSAADLFGSVVPHPLVGTKAITHGLVHARAARPPGWPSAFAARVREAVLPGYTVFSARDARTAITRLLRGGAVRAKDPRGAASRGQTVIDHPRDLDKLLESWDREALARHGLVLERNLARVRCLSVGQVSAAGLVVSYHGVQRETLGNDERPTYGGSELVCVRGGWDALERLDLSPEVRHAVAQARIYDAATEVFPGFIASRRNYDVGQGADADGRAYAGVFEASWRPGGASGAEVAALQAFAADPAAERVDVATVERHGEDFEPPADACVHFNRVDPTSGPALRYTRIAAIVRRVA
ncbi:MAG TPA: DUF3182 family protein [Methylomirabilota bacterium]|jgi:hypothetical protein